MAAALQEFTLRIDGKDLKSITDRGLYYDQIIEKITSPLGSASVSSFKATEYTNNVISFDATADSLLYPTIKDYAERFDAALREYIKDRKISYNVTKDRNGRDRVTFTLDYTYKMEDFERDAKEAKIKYKREQELIDEYNEAIDDGDIDRANVLKKKLEEAQRLEISPSTSASEMDLQKKAIESETNEEPTPLQTPTVSSKESIIQAPPVIVPPSEKSTIMQSKDLSKEKALIESISSMTFDTKILGYEKSLIERTSSSSVLGGKEPKETPSLPTISKEERGKKKASEAAPSLQTVVPSDVSKIMSSAFSGERSATSESLLGKEVSDSIKNQISQSGLILSSISETVKMMKESIGAATSFIKEGTERITSSFNSISKDSALLIGLTSATSDSIVKKESQPSLISEKNTSTTNILSEIERKVAEIDSVDPLKMGVTSLAENIGNSIKTVVTNLVEGGKKTTIEAPKPLVLSQASTSTTPAPSSVTSVVNQGETGDSNVGSQTNQTFLGGQQGSPSVVSLSQSTIDNLASAIIKNMTLAPFLNSGR